MPFCITIMTVFNYGFLTNCGFVFFSSQLFNCLKFRYFDNLVNYYDFFGFLLILLLKNQ